MVSTINLYCNNKPVTDVGELKNRWDLWKRVKTLSLSPAQAELRFDFTIPIVATNLLIEYASFHDAATQVEKLQCPRCSRTVTDKHGICKHCGDNAYQCRHCRNINYEKLDAFLCNECGFCKHARFEFTLTVRPSYVIERIGCEAERTKLLSLIDSELQNASKRHAQLIALKRPLERLLGNAVLMPVGSERNAPGNVGGGGSSLDTSPEQLLASLPGTASLKINRKISILAMIYSKEAKSAYDSLSKSSQMLQAARTELLRYMRSNSAAPQPAQRHESDERESGEADWAADSAEASTGEASVLLTNRRYDCGCAFVLQVLSMFEGLTLLPWVRAVLLECNFASELLAHNLCNVPRKMQLQASVLLCHLSAGSAHATAQITGLLASRLELGLVHHHHLPCDGLLLPEMTLLTELCSMCDALWPTRLHLLFRVLFRAMRDLSSAFVCERVLLPTLRLVGKLTVGGQPSATPKKTKHSKVNAAPAASAHTPSAASSCASLLGVGMDETPSLRCEGAEYAGETAQGVPLRIAAWIRDPHSTYGNWAERVNAPSATANGPELAVAAESTQECAAATVDGVVAATQGTFVAKADTGSLEGRSLALAQKYVRRWREPSVPSLPALVEGSWLRRLLLCEASQSVREEAAGLLSTLAESLPSRGLAFLDMLLSMLPGACGSPRSSMEYFELLRGMMAADSRKLYAVACGALRQLCNLIDLEARRIRAQEASQMVDMAQGSVLKTLLEILQSLLELPTILTKFKRDEQLPTLLHALLCMRGLIMQKTSTSDECATRLMQMLTTLHEGSEADRRRFVAACISAMSEHAEGRAEDGRSLVFIFEQLCGLVCPEKPEPEYKLMLNKTATQEEFIRGSMTKNPYSSTAVGPLMRDVKNKICRDLDLGGLIEDDNGMELLVAGQIIKLDLTVAAVYEQVWARSTAAQAYAEGSASPMVVVYRLQGLDGEATEPIVDTLEEEGGEEQDPESEFAIADVVGEAGGLEVMMGILKRATPLLRARECSSLLLKFLQHCCKIRSNRRRMLQMQGAKELLCMLPEALSSESLCVVAERLVLTVEALLEEELADLPMPTDDDAEFPIHDGPASMEMESLSPNQGQIAMGGEAMVVVDDAEAFHDYVAIIVGALKSPVTKDAKALIKAITRLLPLVTRGNPARLRALLSHFESCTDFDRFDEAVHSSAVDAFLLECLIATCSSARNVSLAHRLKTAAVHQGLAPLAAAYLTRWLPGEPLPAEERGADTQQRWAAALARPALPLVLQLLGGLAQGHAGVQQLLLASPDLMTRLHALERQSSSATKATGTWAEALLEALRERAAAEVDRLRRATSESKRKAALDKRQQILKSMGMAVKGAAIDGVSDEHGGRAVIVAEGAASSVMEELEEENGHICVVCGEGETYRPGQTLGTYAFCKRVPLLSEAHSVAEAEAAATTSRHDACYSSVTHFNIIHYSCHREAARAERTLKQPKEEWEGATLRNSQTKCNNLFPIWGSSVSSEAYALCVEQWWTTVQAPRPAAPPRAHLQ